MLGEEAIFSHSGPTRHGHAMAQGGDKSILEGAEKIIVSSQCVYKETT